MVKKKAPARAANRQRCSWADPATEKLCTGRVYHTDAMTGEQFCEVHYKRFFLKGERQLMQSERSGIVMCSALADKARKIKPSSEASGAPLPEAAAKPAVIGALEQVANHEAGVVPTGMAGSVFKLKQQEAGALNGLKGGVKASFRSIDIGYYTQGFVDDYFVLLNQKIRRQHAICNIIMHQLLRIEEEEEMLKLTETYGEQMIEGVPVQFASTQKRHATPFDIKLKLLDTWQKHEKEYRELLKQRADTLVNALLILKRYGLKFDHKAAMIVVEVLQRQDQQQFERNLLGTTETVSFETETDITIQSVHQDVLSDFQRADSGPSMADLDKTGELFAEVINEVADPLGTLQDDDW